MKALFIILLYAALSHAMSFEEWKKYRQTEAYQQEQKELEAKRNRTRSFTESMYQYQEERASRPEPSPVQVTPPRSSLNPHAQPQRKEPQKRTLTNNGSQFFIYDVSRVIEPSHKALLERILQKIYAFHSRHFNLTSQVTNKIRIIDSRPEYLNYLKRNGVTSPNETAGVFVKRTEESVVYKHDGYYGTVIHEAQHYLMNKHFKHSPLWLNEGLSEFYERAYINRDGIFVSQSDIQKKQIAKWLRTGDIWLIRNVVTMPDREWWILHKGPEYKSRVVSWSIVYFLMSTGERQALFSQMIKALKNGEGDTLAVINRYYAGGLERFERDWFAFFKNVPPTIAL